MSWREGAESELGGASKGGGAASPPDGNRGCCGGGGNVDAVSDLGKSYCFQFPRSNLSTPCETLKRKKAIA